MSSTKRGFLGAAVAAIILAMLTSPVLADTTDEDEEEPECTRGCGDGGSDPDTNDLWAEAIQTAAGGDGTTPIATGSSYFLGCDFDQVAAGEPYETGRDDVASVNVDNSVFPVDQWVIFCPDRVGQGPLGFDAYTFYPVGDPPPAPVIDAMISDAYSRTPVVAFNPLSSPDGDDDIPLVTQMTTFLWVDEVAWVTPVSAVASIPGFTVTTTAIPSVADWGGGNNPRTCTGDQMEPYVFGIGGDDAQPSDCTMVFGRSSAVVDQEITLAVTWTVGYTCSIPVCGGPLPDIVISSVRPVTVAEIQAIESAGRP